MSFYALRYIAGTPLKDRKHAPTLGRWDDYAEADDARERRPGGHLMDVVVRGEGK